MSSAGFLNDYHLGTLLFDSNPAELIQKILTQEIIYQPKWNK